MFYWIPRDSNSQLSWTFPSILIDLCRDVILTISILLQISCSSIQLSMFFALLLVLRLSSVLLSPSYSIIFSFSCDLSSASLLNSPKWLKMFHLCLHITNTCYSIFTLTFIGSYGIILGCCSISLFRFQDTSNLVFNFLSLSLEICIQLLFFLFCFQHFYCFSIYF